MRFRTAPSAVHDGGGPPDYRGLAEELGAQLHEIETILAKADSSER